MAGLIGRMSLVIKSKNSLDRAEDPPETLDYFLRAAAPAAPERQAGDRGRRDLQEAASAPGPTAGAEPGQAGLAATVAAGREDFARAAPKRKTLAQQQLQDLDGQIEQLDQQQQKLAVSEKQLGAKIEAFRSQKEVIKAQYSAAEAQVRIGEAATGIGEQMADTGLAIERAREQVLEQMAAGRRRSTS